MLYVYIGAGAQRIELSSAIGISGTESGQGLISFTDGTGNVVARIWDRDITAFSKVDLGASLPLVTSSPAFSGTGTGPTPIRSNGHSTAEVNQLAEDIEAMNVPVPVAAFAGQLESTPMPE